MLIFGIVGAIFCFITASEGEDAFFGLLGIGILFFLAFYTIGWRSSRKNIIN